MILSILFSLTLHASQNCKLQKTLESANYYCQENEILLKTNTNFLRINPFKEKQFELESCLDSLIPNSYGQNVILNSKAKAIYGHYMGKLGAYVKMGNEMHFIDFSKYLNSDNKKQFVEFKINNESFVLKSSKNEYHLMMGPDYHFNEEFKVAKNNKSFIQGEILRLKSDQLDHEYFTAIDSAIAQRIETLIPFYQDQNSALQKDNLPLKKGYDIQEKLLKCQKIYSSLDTYKKDPKLSLNSKLDTTIKQFQSLMKLSRPQTGNKDEKKSANVKPL
jgi:hypothetical protein